MKKINEHRKKKENRKLVKKSSRNNANFKQNKKILFASSIGLMGLSIILISIIFFANSCTQENTENMICKEFQDNVLFTSDYSTSPKGSEKYQTWTFEINCSEAGGTNCFLQNISLNARIRYVNPSETESERESYIQISNPDESICGNPERGIYSEYLLQEKITGLEGQINGWYCGEEKYETSRCGIKLSDKFNEKTSCYGIKAYSSQYSIVDAVQIKYSWCWKQKN